jgi:hypothetical protein
MGWLTGWTYRKNHFVNPTSGAGQNYQKRIIVHFGAGISSGEDVYLDGKCRTDFGDIRFTNSSGAFALDYWMEEKVNSNYAVFWVKISDDLNVYNVKIFIYYGNAGATPTSNGDSTFIFFDDFETNLNKWNLFGTTSALRFSGSNNLGSPLGFGTIGDFDGYSPFTLECWFRTSNTGEQPLLTRMNLGGNGRGYCLFVINNHIGYELRNSSTPSNDIQIETNVRTVNNGDWHHVIATYDGSQQASGIHIYLDGTEEPFTILVNTLNGTISNPSKFNAATYGGFYWLTGDMDEILVYTSVLTLPDVVTRYNNGEGTEVISGGDVYTHWTLDEGSGTDVIDGSGHPERNLWLATASGGLPSWITGIVGAPVISLDHAYSGLKCVKIPTYSNISHIQTPYGDKAVHVQFYDEMLPITEYTVVSTDAGESEVSFIGLIHDIDQYEYQLQGNVYNSGVNRAVGWHEFVIRSTNNLKQFIIDENIMPITGLGNYCPRTWLITSSITEAPAYWDTIFITKFVYPEPSHGTWGVEETGGGITIYIAEDIENSISMNPVVTKDIIYSTTRAASATEDVMFSLSGSLHIPITFENITNALSRSLHIPTATDDILFSLTKTKHLTEDIINVLSSSLHVPISSEDIMYSSPRIKILFSEDIINALPGSLHVPVLFEDVILTLSAREAFIVVPDFITSGTVTVAIFPIIGGSHIIQIVGGED